MRSLAPYLGTCGLTLASWASVLTPASCSGQCAESGTMQEAVRRVWLHAGGPVCLVCLLIIPSFSSGSGRGVGSIVACHCEK